MIKKGLENRLQAVRFETIRKMQESPIWQAAYWFTQKPTVSPTQMCNVTVRQKTTKHGTNKKLSYIKYKPKILLQGFFKLNTVLNITSSHNQY